MTDPKCPACGKPTPAGSVHTCSPPYQAAKLAEAFDRSADWLEKGVLHGNGRTHPLVGLADYRTAAVLLRALAERDKVLAEAREAITNLCDEQGFEPIPGRREEWMAACVRCTQVLARIDALAAQVWGDATERSASPNSPQTEPKENQ